MYKSILLFFICSSLAFSQGFTVKGTARDDDSKKPLISASVQLLDRDSVSKYHAITDKSGNFDMTDVKPGPYNLKITYIGYKPFTKPVKIFSKESFVNLGNVDITPDDIQTDEVVVNAKAPIGEQKEDTTIFNASSFKTTKDATAEDLVKKMPGVEVDQSGTVKAQGEEVKKVMVDGKPFFGDDPTAALRNLPSEVIDKVQIYDKMSEQSEFSGFDDGQTTKTMNIITKALKRNGQFGKFSAGYGHQDKYNASLNLNIFQGAQRISILGLSNNVNQQNFAVMDILDMVGTSTPQSQMFRSFVGRGGLNAIGGMSGGRGPGGGGGGGFGGGQNFFVGQTDGISTTHALGGNYSDTWTEGMDVTGSYFYNYTTTKNTQLTDRLYNLNGDTAQSYNQNTNSFQKNINHKFNFKYNYQIDTNTSIMIKPAMTVQATNPNSNSYNQNLMDTIRLNSSNNINTSGYTGYNFSNEFLFKYRFGVVGRTISIDVNTGLNDKNGGSTLLSYNTYYRGLDSTINILDQLTNYPTNGYNYNVTVNYTEPIHKDGQLLLKYNLTFNNNQADRRTYFLDSLTNNYSVLDSVLSNQFDNDYLYQSPGIAYRYKIDKLQLTAAIDYQMSELKSNQLFPQTQNDINYKYKNWLPSMRINYKFDQRTSLMLNYRTSTSAPSVTQLQNVIDNSNPLQISIGNPNLQQSTSNYAMIRYNTFSSDFNNVFFFYAGINNRMNYIGNSTLIVAKDTVIGPNIIGHAGGQIAQPVNINGFWNINGMMNFGFPIPFIGSKMTIGGGGMYSRTPSLVNNADNISDLYNINVLGMLTSNISENVDFNLSFRANVNQTRNSLDKSNNYSYNNYLTTFNLKWIFWEGIFIQTEGRNQFYTGYTAANANFTMLNFHIGKKLLGEDNGELKLSVYDLLNQGKSTQTNVTDYYTEYQYNTALQRYIMLTFTYNLRMFGK